MRKSKRLSSKYYFLFDNNCVLKDEILNDKFEFSFDSGSIISYKEKNNLTALINKKIECGGDVNKSELNIFK